VSFRVLCAIGDGLKGVTDGAILVAKEQDSEASDQPRCATLPVAERNNHISEGQFFSIVQTNPPSLANHRYTDSFLPAEETEFGIRYDTNFPEEDGASSFTILFVNQYRFKNRPKIDDREDLDGDPFHVKDSQPSMSKAAATSPHFESMNSSKASQLQEREEQVSGYYLTSLFRARHCCNTP
jgi:hypothetical protein